jgi:predicted nucleic acid-binding protein
MPAVIITDASCLILLDKIGRLDLLSKVYGSLLTTPEVAAEFGKALPEWLAIQSPQNANIQRMAEANLDPGESSAIALAIEKEDCLLILDDLKGRKFAESLGIAFTGTLGVVIEAKLSGAIPSVKTVLNEIRQTNFRLTDKLEQLALKLSGE